MKDILMRILSFDIGIIHLAAVVVDIPDDALKRSERIPMAVLHCDLINITEYTHNTVPTSECKLHHTREITDRVHHMLQEYAPKWRDCEKVLLERQPLCGLVHVEALLFNHFRQKVAKVSPNAMHKHFGLSDDYETRKQQTVAMAHAWLHDRWTQWERRHDVADALVLAAYWATKERERQHDQARLTRIAMEKQAVSDALSGESTDLLSFIENCRHKPSAFDPSCSD